MEQNGTSRPDPEALRFCGQEACRVDANGRVRLPPGLLRDFRDLNAQAVVLHCLPEGALAIYPVETWQQMQNADPSPAEHAVGSAAYRRRLRRLGAMTRMQRLTNQGRITIPAAFREPTGLQPGAETVLVGCRIGVEVWHAPRWREELEALQDHERRKAEAEMTAEVRRMADSGPADSEKA